MVPARRVPQAPLSAAYLAGLSQLVEQLPVVAWSTDTELRITSVAGGAVIDLGISPAEAIGREISTFLDDSRAAALTGHRQALTGVPGSFSIEFNSRTFDVTIHPLHSAGGSIVGTVGLALDVSGRVQALSALERSETHYRALVDDAAVGIFRSSPEGRFLAVNPALVAMLGYDSADELRDLDIAAEVYVDPTLRDRLTTRYANASRIAGVDVEWRRRDGSAITVRLSGRPVRSSTAEITSWEMVAEDVTEFRRIEHQLRQSQKMEALGRLTGGVAHDFNNILTAILANTDLIESAIPEHEAQIRADLRDIAEAARRGGDLVKKLLGFSRRERLQILPSSLAQAIEAAGDEVRRLVPSGVSLKVTTPPDLPPVLLDTTALAQIVVSLVTNARDAMPRGGSLLISCERIKLDQAYREAHGWGTPGDYVALVIRDTGLGMDEETKKRAFEPFFTTKPPGAGSGLGLAMVYGLMKQMNGFVRLESEPGEGTRVTMFFPVATRPSPASLRSPLVAPRSGAVLIVEDEEPIRRVAQRVLERFGYKVIVAPDGQEALRIWSEKSAEIGLVLTDIVMPRMGGRELYEELRRLGANVPVVFTSGHTQRGELDGEAGGLDPSVPFLPKPWSADELVGRVKSSMAP